MATEKKNLKRNIEPFNGEKYSIWKFRVRALIAEENALQVLDEEIPLYVDEEWKKDERAAKGIIIASLSDQMLSFAQGDLTAYEIITKLDETYARQSLATRLTIEKK